MGARTASLGLEKVVKRQDCGRRAAVDEVEGNRGFGGSLPARHRSRWTGTQKDGVTHPTKVLVRCAIPTASDGWHQEQIDNERRFRIQTEKNRLLPETAAKP
ncbi:hypothetical protein ACFQ4Y_16530 [Kroppenstedtia sanguinis]|uniref:Uncharacterized protein n=1 Tax=Kroppenstedtia sanguinis TaxID=1380684 RepID=A0ABW4CDY4_9BACL